MLKGWYDQDNLGSATGNVFMPSHYRKRISIIQSCYIPWKGFFDLISRCDEYVVFDQAQFVKGHWHNRNRIKTKDGVRWLTIPVNTSGRLGQPIEEVEVSTAWAEGHWTAIEQAYRTAAHFDQFAPLVRTWYEAADKQKRLTDINTIFLEGIARSLGLATHFSRDTKYPARGFKTERLLNIIRSAGADYYLTGPSARSYLDEALLRSVGVTTEWMAYEGYRHYRQLHGDFEHAVSTLDLLFNAGAGAAELYRGSTQLEKLH